MKNASATQQKKTVCAYCRQVFKREDHDAILEHIQTCEKRPEKLILEAWEREAKELKYRIALLYDAAMEVVDKHQEEGEFEAIKALAILLLKGPNDGTLEEPEA